MSSVSRAPARAKRAGRNGVKPNGQPPANGNGHAVIDVHLDRLSDPPKRALIETIDVDPAMIAPSPFQPRQSFPEDEIAGLAESIRNQGQLQPVIVRAKPGYHGNGPTRVGGQIIATYELVDGERRWRAVKLAGLETIRAEVHRLSDVEAREIVLVSAMQRADLNPIEEAIAFKRALDAGDAKGPTELAKRLGVSQGHVSSRLGLLKLPEKWRKKVITREIPPTHARCLAPYADEPAILKELEHWMTGDCGPLKDFERVVQRSAMAATREMSGKVYYAKEGRNIPIFKPNEEQKAQLGIIEVKNWSGKLEERATNKKLWQKLQDAHAQEWVKKHPTRQPAEATRAVKRKLTADEEQELARKARERHARALSDFLAAWILELVPAAIRAQANVPTALLVAGHCMTASWVGSIFEQNSILEEVLKPHGVKLEKGKERWSSETKTAKALAELPNDDKRAAVICEYCARLIGQLKPIEIQPTEVLDLAEALSIDLEEAWKTEQRGDRGRAFYELHSQKELFDLATKEFAIPATPSHGKAELIRIFQESKRALPFPKSLKKARVG